MARRTSISQARAHLPELARRVAATPGRVEYISHRDLEEDIAMTTRSHLRFLEDSLNALRARTASSFVVAGSIETDLSDGELDVALESLRQDAKAGSDLKQDGLSR